MTDIRDWDGSQHTRAQLEEQIKSALSSEYNTFPANKETKDHYYFSRDILGQSILINKIGQDQDNVKKYIYSYNEYPLNWAQGTEYALSKSPVTTLIFVQGNEGQEKTAFIFHIRESNTREFYADKKIPVLDIPEIGRVGNVIEIKMSLKKYETGLSFEELFEIEKISKYNPSSAGQQFAGIFREIPNSDKLKVKFDQAITSQHASDGEVPLQAYKALLTEVAGTIYPIKDLITNEARLQAVFNGLLSSYSDLKLQETSAKTVIIPEFQVGAGRVDMVIQGIGPSPQGTKEYTPIALEFKLIDKNLDEEGMKKEVNKLTKEQNIRYAKGAALKAITDSDKMLFMGVVVNVKPKDKNSLILTSDKFVPATVVHSSIHMIHPDTVAQSLGNLNLNDCVGQSSRSKRSINNCLFSGDDVEKFSKGKVDENNADKIIIDSEKFLTYVKNSQDEAKNAQLVEFIGDKNIEGDHKYLLDKVVGDQGYERYVQNERTKDLYSDVSQQTSSSTKNSKLKGRLMNAAGGIQLIRGIHGAIVSCKDGTATDCGLNLGGIAWSFASQPIENVMVKITPKVVVSAEKVVGKIIPGTLGKQTKFAIRVVGVKFGSTIARGTAGALTGVFDIVDIGMSASNLVDCKKRENSDNPCGEKEIRDNIASISFSGVSFVSGVALTAASMPGVGIAVGFGLMVGYGIYSGVSNIVEYEKKYDTTHEENWSIFWRTLLFQGMASDVQHLATRKDAVNSLAKEVWKALNNGPNSVVAYGVGLGEGNPLRPCSAKIVMSSQDADTRGISRVIPDSIKNAKMICLPRITNADYEKGLKKSVPTAVHYCDNAMVIADGRKSMQSGKTVVYDLRNVNFGSIIGSNKLDNSFIIFEGSEKVIGGDNTVNRFVVTNSEFAGQIIVGTNSTNVFDLSQIADDVVKVNIVHSIGSTISKTLHSGVLEIKMNDRSLINECVTNDVNILGYHYIGRQNKIDEVSCTSSTGDFIDYDTIIDSKGGYNNDKRDIIENCDRAIILPYTNAKGVEGNYTFYVRNAEYTGTNLYSEIDVKGTGTVIFPETDLLNDCDEITYSSNNNTLSLKIGLGQNNRYTLDIKNYIKQSTSKPNFILIDKNGSNIVPKIKELGATKINSFELHSEYALDNFDDVENHYKKILNNNKDYKVFSVIRGKTQSQDNNAIPHMFFGSLEDDIVNFDQGTTFARGGEGNDVYLISSDINSREVKIDNNSDDRKLDVISMPEISEEFRIQECDLYLDYNNTNIQVKNYLKDNRYRHLTVMNSKGEAFIPYMQSASCVGSSEENGKLVPFFHATQTQSMFLLSKNFQGDRIVIDSRLEDIEKYKDKDDLLLIRESEIPFIIRIEGFYTDRSKWENISYSLWNNNDLFPSPGLLGNIDNVMECKDKLRDDYKKVVKEYIIDFSNSTNIEHNQKLERNISTFIGQEEERIGVMILKNIAPNQIEVSSSGTDLIFCDKRSNHTVNIKGWNNSKSYRISTLEFDLGLEPITIRRLDRFSLSEVGKIQDLIGKASENYQNRDKYTPKTENDFKCLISIDSFESENRNPTYQCLGFSSLQDQINFTENVCSVEQIEDFRGKISNNDQVLLLLKKLQNDLSLNDYDQNIIDQCNKLMITSELEILKLLINNAAQKGEWERVKDLLDTTANRSNADIENKKGWSSTWTLLHYAVYNGNLDLLKDTYQLLLSKVIDVNAKDKYGWTPLYYAIYYNEPEMVEFFIDKGANIDIKNNNGKTPVEVANEYGKPKIMSILINKVIENGQFDVVKNFLKKTAKKTSMKDENEWRIRWKLLHYAAYNGELNIVKDLFSLLLEKSGDVNVKEGYYSYTPLHCAVYYNRH
ncbi:ankyrin repeat domain-containing protein [Wolbachia pipientis]|uniref:ankyrin repeat domain-containing protein n=1 Tax=Wolbachia pipientis TaxID=955 RepID=UPI0016512025|nr:ankyrin repeat domain-containing protein [Wolbachia pipientis]MBC6686134.1 ankyrin repeat domain-containing protein [Wolbachia pipientis]